VEGGFDSGGGIEANQKKDNGLANEKANLNAKFAELHKTNIN